MKIVKPQPEITDVVFADIDRKDRPDYCDAYISSARCNGVDMTEDELEELNNDKEFVHSELSDYLN